jgi:carbamoyltransferase
MWILGIQKQADGAVCLLKDGKLIYYAQEERISRIKRDSYPFQTINKVKEFTDKIDKVVFSGYDFVKLENQQYFKQLKNIGLIHKNSEWIEWPRSHHVAHAFNAFYHSGFSEAICIVCDGQGSEYKLKNGNTGSETTSVFTMRYPDIINPIYKNIHLDLKNRQRVDDLTIDWEIDPTTSLFEKHLETHIENCEISYHYDFDVGCMYQSISNHLGFGHSECGKTMGLSSYGQPNEKIPNLLLKSENSEFYSNMNLFLDRGNINTDLYPFLSNKKENQSYLNDLSYMLQRAVEVKNLHIINKILNKNLSKNLIITGGVALNVVANAYYKKNLPKDINLYIEPICEDYGNCIGLSKLLFYSVSKSMEVAPLDTVYLGAEPSYEFTLNENEILLENVNEQSVVDLLIKGNIIAIFQGKSEAGPRALGNRSLLFDPRNPDAKNIVNQIKKREWFRPFAATILEEEAHKWFDLIGLKNSSFMMYALECLPGIKDKIPGVVHVDGTCRIQTVNVDQNKNLYKIITSFFIETGVPILLNTSFNLAGDPMVETISDALNTLRKSQLQYLYLPEISKMIVSPNINET